MSMSGRITVGTTPYKPKVSCDLYVPEKNECAGLNALVCAECGKCAFYKSRKRHGRIASPALWRGVIEVSTSATRRRGCCCRR